MCKQRERSIYLKNAGGNILKYTLVYSRLDETDIKCGYYDQGWGADFTLWALEKLGGTVHVPTIADLTRRFFNAEVLGNVAWRKYKSSRGNPRYITVLTLLNGRNEAICGGSSVCAAMDEPDRSLGYRLAFERMKNQLHDSGYTIIPAVEAKRTLGL